MVWLPSVASHEALIVIESPADKLETIGSASSSLVLLSSRKSMKLTLNSDTSSVPLFFTVAEILTMSPSNMVVLLSVILTTSRSLLIEGFTSTVILMLLFVSSDSFTRSRGSTLTQII